MEKLLLTAFEKKCSNCRFFEVQMPEHNVKLKFDKMKVVLHPNRVCLIGNNRVYCINGVKYILSYNESIPYLFDVVSKELDNDTDIIHTIKVF